MLIYFVLFVLPYAWAQAVISPEDLKVASKFADIGPFPKNLTGKALQEVQRYINSYQKFRNTGFLKDGGVGDLLPLKFDPSLNQNPPCPTTPTPTATTPTPTPSTTTPTPSITTPTPSITTPTPRNPWNIPIPLNITRPENNETIFLLPLIEIAGLLRNGEISSFELTQISLDRLKTLDEYLEMVITFTDNLALKQALQADDELQRGVDRGILHGVPYGLKDIISVGGYLTTWGAEPFKNQVFDQDALVYQKLRDAGAVLVAKLTTGAMASYDRWFGGQTLNPWNLLQNSGGSSAGSAASVSSLSLPYAIGSETWGSLTFPAERVGITTLRPTFGTAGRSGVMALSPSMDKIGPMCRHALDCAIVLKKISGKDDLDTASLNENQINFENPFNIDVKKLRVGVYEIAEEFVVNAFIQAGVEIVYAKDFKGDLGTSQPYVSAAADIILMSETAANFDEWLRENKMLQMMDRSNWPELILGARYIPAVEYINANRLRSQIIQNAKKFFEDNQLDAVLGHWYKFIDVGNLVGLPEMVFPVGFVPVLPGSPRMRSQSQSLLGPLFSDMKLAALVNAFQEQTDFHLQIPPIQNVEPAVLEHCKRYSRCRLQNNTDNGK